MEPREEGSIEEARKVIEEHWNMDATKRPTPKQATSDAKYYGNWSGWAPTAPIQITWTFGNTSI